MSGITDKQKAETIFSLFQSLNNEDRRKLLHRLIGLQDRPGGDGNSMEITV